MWKLDRLRGLAANQPAVACEYQAQLVRESGIPSLKVGYNKVFGYYIEVTEAHRDRPPMTWTRKQDGKERRALYHAGAEEFESETLSARDRSIALEQTLFEQVRQACCRR